MFYEQEDSKLFQAARELISEEELKKLGDLTPIDTSANRVYYANLLRELLEVGSNGST